ncbi:hypothetical protein [Aliikangiella coralliicola]|uniref:hypothetical protein n=1 Tax=Aliikangiella coralliicola TaxID=2592383 RepID=UPI00143DFAD4|nr:hypothetical protein [Aliikangiella coralliicola]
MDKVKKLNFFQLVSRNLVAFAKALNTSATTLLLMITFAAIWTNLDDIERFFEFIFS